MGTVGGVVLFLQTDIDYSGVVSEVRRVEAEKRKEKSAITEIPSKDKVEEQKQKLEERRIIAELQRIDAKVRAHEMAHAAVGGPYAGAPSYSYVKGPDGRLYAVAGEVPIDVSPEDDPLETVRKMERVIAAALAPADPSPQDYKVAAQAAMLLQKALIEYSKQKEEEKGRISSLLRFEPNNRVPQGV